MATWTVHLRIAQKFIDSFPFLDKKEFIAGSLAPDCGYKISERTFNPPPKVTHFSKTGMKNDCDYKEFANRYLLRAKNNKEHSFYLGYYIHLLTDILWSFIIYVPTYDMYGTDPNKNPEFIKKLRSDWSLMDAKYYCENSDFAALNILLSITQVDDYIDFYESGQIMFQLKEIISYYERHKQNPPRKSPKFISKQKVDDFINSAFETISLDLKNKKLDKPL